MKYLKKMLLGCLLGSAICVGSVVDAQTTIRNGPAGNSKANRAAIALQDQLNSDGTLNAHEFKIVNLAPDATTFSIGTGTMFYTGSNTAATALGSLTNETVGQIFCIVTTGGANYTTIADAGPGLGGAYSIAGSGGFAPDSADDNIWFLVQADNDYIQIFGTQTNN